MKRSLLPRGNSGQLPFYAATHSQPLDASLTLLLVGHIVLGMSGPVLLDWVKKSHDGHFAFHVPAMTFHAYMVSAALGIGVACTEGIQGLKKLNRPDLLWRHVVTACLFTIGDMLSFSSMRKLDAGTSSLIGKSFGIVSTVILSRALIHRRHTLTQYGLVLCIICATLAFCRSDDASSPGEAQQDSTWALAAAQRAAATVLTSLGAVLQERFLAYDADCHFMQQQCWLACGGLLTSFSVFRFGYGLRTAELFVGFDDWRVCVVLAFYVTYGLSAGLMVKRLGALVKALCVPVTLGGCYLYAVSVGSAALVAQKVLAWTTSTTCIAAYAISKASGSSLVMTKSFASR